LPGQKSHLNQILFPNTHWSSEDCLPILKQGHHQAIYCGQLHSTI
jgi:hypothetical protein